MPLSGNNLALFTSEIAPTAWKQISCLPQDKVDFQGRVIRLLEIAQRLPTDPLTVPAERTDRRTSAQ